MGGLRSANSSNVSIFSVSIFITLSRRSPPTTTTMKNALNCKILKNHFSNRFRISRLPPPINGMRQSINTDDRSLRRSSNLRRIIRRRSVAKTINIKTKLACSSTDFGTKNVFVVRRRSFP